MQALILGMLDQNNWGLTILNAHQQLALLGFHLAITLIVMNSISLAYRHPKQPVHLLVDPRLNASRLVLSRAPIDVDDIKNHLASHVGGDNGWTVCMHATVNEELVELTTASMVAELDRNDSVIHWAQGPPCVTPYETAMFSELSQRLERVTN